MMLYHGSESIIEKPVYGKGKTRNDYGRGFYCTQDMDLAREWAVDEHRDGFVNTYEIDMSKLRVLDLNSDNYCVLHWITMLLHNRSFELDSPLSREAYRYLTENFSVDVSNIDVIKGYRADDSYFSYAQDFINGVISVAQLNRAMHLGSLGEQLMLRSKKAFSSIVFSDSEGVSSHIWFAKKVARDRAARQAYYNMSKEAYIKGDLYMIRIIDEEVKQDDERLR